MEFIYTLPDLLPGETIHSLVSRQHRLSGCENVSRTLTTFFGKASRTLDSDLPCCLGHMALLFDVDRLINDHTLLGLFSPFLGPERTQLAREKMLGQSGVGLKMSLGITAAGFERYRLRRLCRQCVRDDFLRQGVSYWHVIHQASGMFVCPIHRCPLSTIEKRPQKNLYRDLRLPDDPLIIGSAHRYDLTATQFQRMANLADIINWGYEHPDKVGLLLTSDFLKLRLARSGFTAAGRLKLRSLHPYLLQELDTYPPLDECCRLRHVGGTAPPWTYTLLRPRPHTHHPLHYYCFLDLLRVTTSELEVFLQEHSAPITARRRTAAAVARCSDRQVEISQRRNSFITEAQVGNIRRTSGYMWLYRHDRQWLLDFVAKRPKPARAKRTVDWVARDAQLSVQVREAVDAIRTIEGKPVRVTLTALSRQLGLPLDVFKQATLLPLTFEVLAAEVESTQQFQRRKIRWAVAALSRDHHGCARSVLLRKAGIRKCVLPEAELSSVW